MATQTDGDVTASEDAELAVTRDFTFRDAGPCLKITDRLSGCTLSFALEIQHGPISYVAKSGPRTEQTDVGLRLHLHEFYPFLVQFVGERRRRGREIAIPDAAEMVRQAIFEYATAGNRLAFVPDYFVTWKDAALQFDAASRTVFDDTLKLRVEEQMSNSGWYTMTDVLTGNSIAIPPGSTAFANFQSFLDASNQARPECPLLMASALRTLRASIALLRSEDPAK